MPSIGHRPFAQSIMEDVVYELGGYIPRAEPLLKALAAGDTAGVEAALLNSVLWDGELSVGTRTYDTWHRRFDCRLYEVPNPFPDEWDDWGILAATKAHVANEVTRIVLTNRDELVRRVIHASHDRIRGECAHWGAYAMPECLKVLVDRLRSGDNYGKCNAEVTSEILAIKDEQALVMAWAFGTGLTSFEKWSELLRDVKPVIIKCHDDDDSYPSCCDWTGGSGD